MHLRWIIKRWLVEPDQQDTAQYNTRRLCKLFVLFTFLTLVIYTCETEWWQQNACGMNEMFHTEWSVLFLGGHPRSWITFPSLRSMNENITLRWRHNCHNSVSNHQPHDCLLNNRLLRRRSKKTSKLCVTGLCAGNSSGTGEFPAQVASNAENVSIWWHHHDQEPGHWSPSFPVSIVPSTTAGSGVNCQAG